MRVVTSGQEGGESRSVPPACAAPTLSPDGRRQPADVLVPDQQPWRPGGVAKIYLYDEIGMWGVSAAQFVDGLKQIVAPVIELHINSPGGEVFDGQAIYASLKAHPAHVHTVVDGLAASAASVVAMAGDKITTARNSMWMIHNAAGLCWGEARDMRQMADLLDKLSDNIADIYTQRAGGTVADWRARMDAETWYDGAEAVAAGLADAMTDPDEEPDTDEAEDDVPAEMSTSWDLSAFRYAGRAAAPAPPGAVREQEPGTPMGGGQPVEPLPATDPLGLTGQQRTTSELAALLPEQFVSVAGARAACAPAAGQRPRLDRTRRRAAERRRTRRSSAPRLAARRPHVAERQIGEAG